MAPDGRPESSLKSKRHEDLKGRLSPLSIARAPTRATPLSAWSSRPNTAREPDREEGGYSLEQLPVARPLRLENASADLIEELERISGQRPRCQLADEIIQKANGRVEEFVQASSSLPRHEIAKLARRNTFDFESSEAAVRFAEVLAAIESAFGGAPAVLPPITLRPGSVLDQSLEANSILAVTVPLPRRRVEVLVSISRLSGHFRVYGSDSQPPTSTNYEMEAEGGELCYRHDPDGTGRSSAIVRTALYLSVEAEDQPSTFRLRINLRRLVDANGQWASLQSACKRVEHKLAVIRSDAQQKQQFEERLKEARSHMEQKRKSKKNFRHINLAQVKDWEEGRHRLQSQQAAWKHEVNAKLAEQRREAAEADRDERMTWWVERHELRRLEKQALEKLKEQALQMEQRRAEWLAKLLMVSFSSTLFRTAKAQQKVREEARKESKAVLKLQLGARRFISRRRRRQLYGNVIWMRLAVTAFVRTIGIPAKFIANERMHWFLNIHTGSRDEPSFADLVKRYMAAVRRVQRAFRRILRIRQAHVEAVLAHFRGDHLVRPELAKLWQQQAAQAAQAALQPPRRESVPERPKAKAKRDKKSTAKALAKPPPAPSTHSFRGRRRNAIQVSEPIKLIPDNAPGWVKDFQQGEEVIPHYVRSYVITKFVQEMHASYLKRYTDWQRRKQELEMDLDLSKMSFFDSDKVIEIERVPVKVEVSGIRDLYDQTYTQYKKGDFRTLIHSVRRQWKKAFSGWRRVVMWGALPDQDFATTRGVLSWTRESNAGLGLYSAPVKSFLASPRPSVMAESEKRRSITARFAD